MLMRRASVGLLLLLAVFCLCGAHVASAQQASLSEREKGILEVVVLDEKGEPLPEALVAVPGYRSTTGLNGTCQFGLLPGRYSVLVNKASYRGRRLMASVRPRETTTTQVQLQKLPVVRPQHK
jgi:uncharacterized membrane protein